MRIMIPELREYVPGLWDSRRTLFGPGFQPGALSDGYGPAVGWAQGECEEPGSPKCFSKCRGIRTGSGWAEPSSRGCECREAWTGIGRVEPLSPGCKCRGVRAGVGRAG